MTCSGAGLTCLREHQNPGGGDSLGPFQSSGSRSRAERPPASAS